MTDTIADLLTEIDAIGAKATECDHHQAEHRKVAEAARTEAEQLAAQAAEAARLTHNEVLRRFNTMMRELSGEVDTARKAAIAAIGSGEAVIDSWVRYRLTAARARGRWAAVSGEYQNLTGREAPDVPYRPELRAEHFVDFLRNAMPAAEQQAYNEALKQATAEFKAHKAKQDPPAPGTPGLDQIGEHAAQQDTPADPPSPAPRTRRQSRSAPTQP
ncbi:MAG: hypothetical protein ACRDSZ_15390 [Pseudonocardiaceae bacterium]